MDFRVWAPRRSRVEVVAGGPPAPLDLRELESGRRLRRILPPSGAETIELTAEGDGYFRGSSPGAGAGTRYGFRLEGEEGIYPDPASRSQPDGPHGLSEVVDPAGYSWRDEGWKGAGLAGQVIYELHVGTFTHDGTWSAAIEKLPLLAETGITLLEVMPVAEFPGRFGWGYDGVNLFAPTHLYGTPDDFRRFVDAAHGLGMGVLLDVVYNHFGPDGNYIELFSGDYKSAEHKTDWGDAINFHGDNCGPVREFFIANAGYWVDEFHLDGLRLDAVQAIFDESKDHILAALQREVRRAALGRRTIVLVENELQQAMSLRDCERGGHGIDAAWNDDFHHAARVAMTGHADYYFGDYRGTPQELISATKWGYLYQGQWNHRQQRCRGSAGIGLAAGQFVAFLQNHDQVGNTPGGKRIQYLTSPGRLRAMTALLLLGPGTPLLFQGEEFGASAAFHYFADHETEMSELVRRGRTQSMRSFRRLSEEDARDLVPDPSAPETFVESKLDWTERERHAEIVRLHADLLRLRREDEIFRRQDAERMHGAVLGREIFALRFLGDEERGDRLMVVNLGADFSWVPSAEPLLAPPFQQEWRLLWSSEAPCYLGSGSGTGEGVWNWFPGHATVVFTSQRN